MHERRSLAFDDWFVPVPASQHNAAIAAYEAHLVARNGQPDVARKVLPEREASITRLAGDQSRFKGRIDADLFAAYMRTTPGRSLPETPGVPPELLFVFACVRANTYEAYSVEKLIETAPVTWNTVTERINTTIMFEEYYHTRFLCTIADLFGLPVEMSPQPPLVVRALIAGLGHLPRRIAHPLTLCAEIMGLALFVKLFELAGTLFAAEPALRAAIETRLGEVLADELGHISYNRLQLSPAGLQAARWLLPMVARGSRYGLPGTEALGLCPFPYTAIRHMPLGLLPHSILEQAFIV